MYQNEKMYQAENHCIWGNKNIMVQTEKKYCLEFPFLFEWKVVHSLLGFLSILKIDSKVHLGQHLRMYHCRIGNLKRDQHILKY